MKQPTTYRVIKKGVYKFLQYSDVINLLFITFIRWKYILNPNNTPHSPLKHNKYLTNHNSDFDAFINKYSNISDYLKKDYQILKQKSLQEFREFQNEASTMF